MEKRSSIFVGSILILAGLFFLLAQFIGIRLAEHWPLIIIALGGLFLLLAIFGRNAPLAIPGAILTGLGGLLYYQSLSGHWSSWAYAWTLIPGFVGVGVALMHLINGQAARARRQGGLLISVSLALFLIFGSFLGGWLNFGLLWPLLLIFLGIWLLVRNRLRR